MERPDVDVRILASGTEIRASTFPASIVVRDKPRIMIFVIAIFLVNVLAHTELDEIDFVRHFAVDIVAGVGIVFACWEVSR